MPDKIRKLRGDDPRLNAPKKRGGYRRIHRWSGIWEWKTNGYDVLIYSPKRERHTLKVWDLENKTAEEWGEERWRDYCCELCSGQTVYPSEVREYIANVLEMRI